MTGARKKLFDMRNEATQLMMAPKVITIREGHINVGANTRKMQVEGFSDFKVIR